VSIVSSSGLKTFVREATMYARLTGIVLGSALIAVSATRAQPQPAPAAAPSASEARGEVVTRSADRSTYQLPQSVENNSTVSCKASRTLRVVRPAAATAASAKATGPQAPDIDPTLIQHALATGRKLVLADAKCDADGALVTSGVSVEPAPTPLTKEEFCRLPGAKQKAPECQ
jgi:hypothetical protein